MMKHVEINGFFAATKQACAFLIRLLRIQQFAVHLKIDANPRRNEVGTVRILHLHTHAQ